MNILTTDTPAKALQVKCTDDELVVTLADGRVVSVPVDWFPRLAHATAAEREDYELLGDGTGVHWPQIDEDISVDGLLAGKASVEVTGSGAAPPDKPGAGS